MSRIESRIKEAEFAWKTRERTRRELVAKLKINHVLQKWEKSFDLIGDIPWHDDIDSLTKQLKPLTDEYGEIVPKALALHNELDFGMIAGDYTDHKDVLNLASRVVAMVEKFQEEISELERELNG